MNRFNYKQVFLALLVVASMTMAMASENLTVSFLDVGQGDSELVQFHGKNILIDGSTQDMGSRIECYLHENGVSSLDLLVATHPHEDHIGGLITILKDFPIGQVLDSGQEHTSQTFENYLNLIDQKNIPFAVAERGQTIDLDPALDIEVLSPPATHFTEDALNQNSVVLRIAYENISFLFMGDAGAAAENSLIASGYDLDSDFLKVGHHGSSSASSAAFLNAVSPEVSIIEVGAGNDYGHPTQKTLSALQSISSKVFRTDEDGTITVTTDGNDYTITTGQSSCAATAPQSTVTASSLPAQTAAVTTSSDGPFVGSSKSDKYHYPSCSSAKRIKSSNLVTFSSSAEARAAGYSPCSICSPP